MANQPAPNPNQQLVTFLCLALYRSGGEIVVDNIQELKGILLMPSIELLDENTAVIKVDKYIKEERQNGQSTST